MRKPKFWIVGISTTLALGTAIYGWWQLPYRKYPLDNTSPAVIAQAASKSILRPTFADLSYADKSPFEKLDLYLPLHRNGPSPLVIWIHGGGFTMGDKQSMPRVDFGPAPKPLGKNGPYQVQVPDVVALTSAGYAVVSLNYRLGISLFTDAKAAVTDGKAAIRFLRANAQRYGLDPTRFAVWGNSMGGFMAAMLGVTGDQPTGFDDPSLGNSEVSSAVQAVIVWYGAEDRMPGNSLKIANYLSTARSLPPFAIVNGDADPVVSVEQAQRLQTVLTAAGGKAALTVLHGAGHEDPRFMETQMQPSLEFLNKVFGR
ncbi:MAG: alpha/beta hydrolase [Lacunisphaera sp.]